MPILQALVRSSFLGNGNLGILTNNMPGPLYITFKCITPGVLNS